MTTAASSDRPPANLADLVRRAVPPGAIPTGWCHKPIHHHVLEKAPDVVEATRAAISESFGETPHVVIELRAGDVKTDADSEISQAIDRTDGGVLLLGIGYQLAESSP